MRTVVFVTFATLLLLPLAARAQAPSVQACITLYGNTAVDVDCSKLTGGPGPWTPIGPLGQIVLFKNIWGKGKMNKKTGELEVPKKAGVGLAGPLCWNGDLPTLTLQPTTPMGWTVPELVDWQAVKAGGACQLCCYVPTP